MIIFFSQSKYTLSLNFNVHDNVTLLTKSFVLNKITFSVQIICSIFSCNMPKFFEYSLALYSNLNPLCERGEFSNDFDLKITTTSEVKETIFSVIVLFPQNLR